MTRDPVVAATVERGEESPIPSCRLLVVSHPCVVAENQLVYTELVRRGWQVTIAVPARWSHAYARASFAPSALPALEGSMLKLRVILAGRPQRHFYLARTQRILRAVQPDVLFVEQEPFSIAALQWGRSARRARVPFGVQCAENLDRPFPAPARAIRRWTLAQASFVAARSPAAATHARGWGAAGAVAVAPHAVPGWDDAHGQADDLPTVGFAGRIVPEKGVRDLAAALRLLGRRVRLLVAGDGPLAGELQDLAGPSVTVEIVRDLGHARMPEAYARMDVLVLPSRTTPRWAEQFGRVLVEALHCGVAVVGSDSGEIPWVIRATGGGIVFPEGDVHALAAAVGELLDRPEERRRLAAAGREAVERLFSVEAAATALEALLAGALATSRAVAR